MDFKISIIGAGVVGLAIAAKLAREYCEVIVATNESICETLHSSQFSHRNY